MVESSQELSQLHDKLFFFCLINLKNETGPNVSPRHSINNECNCKWLNSCSLMHESVIMLVKNHGVIRIMLCSDNNPILTVTLGCDRVQFFSRYIVHLLHFFPTGSSRPLRPNAVSYLEMQNGLCGHI